MKILIQRVSSAAVGVEDKEVGSIGFGALVFVGITHIDTKEKALWLAAKLVSLRMFSDESGKLNQSLLEAQGAALIVSQFTLYGDCTEGRRPSFTQAAPPALAELLYETFVEEVKRLGVMVQTGVFGAKMRVSLVNEGPLTFLIEK